MTDTTSGALPGLRAGSFTVRPAGSRIGFSTRNLPGTTAAPLTDPWSGEDDDTGYGYCDTPSGNLWRPGAEPAASGDQPGRPGGRPAPRRRSGSRHATGRTAALVPFPDRPHVASPPGRGSVCPDKETP